MAKKISDIINKSILHLKKKYINFKKKSEYYFILKSYNIFIL